MSNEIQLDLDKYTIGKAYSIDTLNSAKTKCYKKERDRSMRPAQTKHIKNSALIGLILGDGSMGAPNRLTIKHGANQISYVNDIISYLRAYLKPTSMRDGIDKFGHVYRYVYFNNSKLKYLYYLIYGENVNKKKKRITRRLLNRFTDVSLAFFYMDDGCLSLRKNKTTGKIKSRYIYLCTHCFSFPEAAMFAQMLKTKFDLDFHITKDKGHPRLWCNTANTKKFIKIVEPIVRQIPSMQYKIDLKYNTTRSETSDTESMR